MRTRPDIFERLKPGPHLLFPYLILLAALGWAGYHYYHEQQQRNEQEARNQLAAIASLKVAQISAWRKERLEDGALVQHHFNETSGLQAFLTGPPGAVPDTSLTDWLQAIKDHQGFQNVTLIDAQGAIRFSLLPQTPLAGPCLKFARDVMESRQVTLSDFHRESDTDTSHLSVAIPISAPPRPAPVGVILLRADPGSVLYPLIQSWPTPSPSAESLLVRREGDRILYLNELRHRKGAPLTFSLPLYSSTNPVIAVDAVAGREGVWSGVDYRGIGVMAAARRVPDSPWYLIAKIDLDEVNTPFHRQTALVAIILLLFVLAAGPAVGLLWQRQQSQLRSVRALLERFNNLSRFANDIILLEDESGRIVEANARAEQVYGYGHEELLGLNARDLLGPGSVVEAESLWRVATGPEGIPYATLHHRKDGSSFPVEVSAHVIVVGGGVFRQKIVRDMTEHRRNEEQLRRAGAYNRGLIEAALDPFVTISPIGTITDVNRATEHITGYPRERLVGTDFSDYFSEPDKARAGYLEAFRAGRVQDYELEIRHRDGHLTPVIYSASVYRDEAGEVIGVFAAARDIAERKKIQAEIEGFNQELEQRIRHRTADLEAANKELEAFTYSTSHDLRAPLRAINGFSRILLERYSSQLPPEAQHYVEVVRQGAVQMGQLIDDLLDLSRLSRQPLKAELVSTADLVRDTLQGLRSEWEGRQIEIVFGDLPSCAADAALLKQVFVNLISNALKYSRRAENAVIEIGSTADADSRVFYVRDNGAGFDMRYVGKLFGVFQRLHSQEEYEGTGVGLAIVDRIIRRHGGRVWAESEPGKGATFYFTLGSAV